MVAGPVRRAPLGAVEYWDLETAGQRPPARRRQIQDHRRQRCHTAQRPGARKLATQSPAIKDALPRALRRPRAAATGPDLTQQTPQQGARQALPGLRQPPGPQGIGLAGGRQSPPSGHLQTTRLIDQAGQIPLGHLGQHGLGLLGALRNGRQGDLGIVKRSQHGRPDLQPQAVAGPARILVGRVFQRFQVMAPDIGLDRLARLRQPGAGPMQALAIGPGGHGRQAGRPSATQGLQQHRLGLVAAVLGQQQQRGAFVLGQALQQGLAARAGPGLDAVARCGLAAEPPPAQPHRPTPAAPTGAQALRLPHPAIGLGQQAVVHMQGNHLQAERHCRATRGMQQGQRIAPAAEGHGHRGAGLCRHAALSGLWCRRSGRRTAAGHGGAAANPWASSRPPGAAHRPAPA